MLYTRQQDALLYPGSPGHSQWWGRYRRRTTVERCFKRLKEDYLLERKSKIRSSVTWYFRAFIDSMCLHVDSWILHQRLDIRPMILQWKSDIVSQAA